jgi:hypothetical protein
MQLKSKLGREIIEKRKEELKSKQRKELEKAQHRELKELARDWTSVRPKIQSINHQMTSLLRETASLVIFLSEPIYLIEMKDSKELKLCRASELKRIGGR